MSLKLKLHTGGQGQTPLPNAAATPSSAGAATPGGFKLKLNASQPPTPATETPTSHTPVAASSKGKGRGGKAQAGGRKRAAADDDISPAPKRLNKAPSRKVSLSLKPRADETPKSATARPKLVTLKQPKRPAPPVKSFSISVKAQPPPRNPGNGYDSEDDGAEDDPEMQQAFILRMEKGADCDYLRTAIANGTVGLPAKEGGAAVSLRFVDRENRRAVVTIRDHAYAAVLVDLPAIVETMKSWDKKNWMKVADLHQMLLVLGLCRGDDEAKTRSLPPEVDKETFQYAHGLTPPMHWVRKRRFRKRLSYKSIANVDEEVERLLKEDEAVELLGGDVTFDYVDRATLDQDEEDDDEEEEESEDYDEDEQDGAVQTVENADGYEDYYDDEEVDLEGNLQAMFDADHAAAAPPAAELIPESPAPLSNQAASYAADENAMMVDSPAAEASTPAETPAGEAETPAAEGTQDEESSSDDDEEEESDDDDEEEEQEDEDKKAKDAERNQQLEEVADLEREVDSQRRKIAVMKNQLLKERAIGQLRTLEDDLRMKRSVFGLDADGDDDGEE